MDDQLLQTDRKRLLRISVSDIQGRDRYMVFYYLDVNKLGVYNIIKIIMCILSPEK